MSRGIAAPHLEAADSTFRDFGSFACRNIYHRQQARRSEHATADALDVSGFRLADGRRVSVLLRDLGIEPARGDAPTA